MPIDFCHLLLSDVSESYTKFWFQGFVLKGLSRAWVWDPGHTDERGLIAPIARGGDGCSGDLEIQCCTA